MGAARPPIVTLDVFLEAIVTPRFVEVVEAPEALLHITVPERESRPQATMIRVIHCVGLAHKMDTLPGVWVTPRLFVPSKLVILVVLHCSALVLYSLLR
jgi:hypothetical protein